VCALGGHHRLPRLPVPPRTHSSSLDIANSESNNVVRAACSCITPDSIIATALVPIGKTETLIYGSRDAGNTIVASDPEFNSRMEWAAKSLNLAGHSVTAAAPPNNKLTIYGPVDMEAHRGYDGRYYLLDLARLFPAEPFDATTAYALPSCFSSLTRDISRYLTHSLDSSVSERDPIVWCICIASCVLSWFARIPRH